MKYYLNLVAAGNPKHDQKIHEQGCFWMPFSKNRMYLGDFSNAIQAVDKAKKLGYSRADGCAVCCQEAHRR